jgi:protein O-GlcNAc transferase
MAYELQNKPLIMHNVASVKLEQCLYSEAIQLENTLIASGNATAHGHTIIGNAYSKLLDTKNAELHFQRALDVDPKFAPAYFQWGIMLDLRKNDLRGAIEKYKLCLQADPNFFEAAANLAYANDKLGEKAEAQKFSEKAFSIIKTNRLNVDCEIKGNALVIGESSATREKKAKARASVCR